MDLRETLGLSIVGLTSHRLRTALTMLGIVFGVAAVIAMLSIGEGAKQEALDQIKQMGISNIIIQHWQPDDEGEGEGERESGQNRSEGLTRADARAIAEICPLAEIVSPQREMKVKAQVGSTSFQTMVVGTTPNYLDVLNARMDQGVFLSEQDMVEARRVCVLGSDAKRKLFFFEEAVGKQIKLRDQWYTVVGILEDKGAAGGKIGGVLEVRNTDEDIYMPLSALLKRYKWEPSEAELTQITVKITESERLQEAATIVRAIVKRRQKKS